MMWYWGGGGVAWWGWLVMSLGMVAFWGLVIWGVWALVTGLAARPTGTGPEDARRRGGAKQILDERLARGEIDADEYRRLRDLITGERVGAGNGRPPVASGDRP